MRAITNNKLKILSYLPFIAQKTGHSITIWQNGKVVKIPPEEIVIPEEVRELVEDKAS